MDRFFGVIAMTMREVIAVIGFASDIFCIFVAFCLFHAKLQSVQRRVFNTVIFVVFN